MVAPESLEGMKILDLGSGSGQDCFVLSKLVGENGHVTGVDMTKEQVCENRLVYNNYSLCTYMYMCAHSSG